ncbi:MAG: DUF2002 family protein [Candidatus Thiodiazotropha endolucinida]
MLNLNEIERLLIEHGASDRHEVSNSIRYYLPKENQYIYLNKQAGNRHSGLVLHPRFTINRDTLVGIEGVHSSGKFNHKSSYLKFPKRYNSGKDKIHYGIPFGFDSENAFTQFINILKTIFPHYTSSARTQVQTRLRRLAKCYASKEV